MKNKKALLVCTDKKGVFFGYGKPELKDGTITLQRARMAVYWSADVRGVLGLCANGPTKSCRIGPAAPSITLTGVTAVAEVSDAAVQAWEDGQWS